MILKPHLNRILAEKIENINKTKSGIEFNSKQEVEKAIVIDISNNLQKNSNINKGDTIFFEPHLVLNIKLENKNLILINYEDVVGFIKKEEI